MVRTYNRFYSRIVDWVGRYWYMRQLDRNTVIHILKKLRPKKILDFGCNTGFYASEIKKHIGAEVFATDINKYALNVGRKEYRDVRFISLDKARSMKGCFDAIIVSHVLEHIPDCSRTVAFLKTLLAPDGRLIIAVPQERFRGDCNLPHILLLSIQKLRYINPHLHVLKFDVLGSLLKKHGMSIENYFYVNFLPPFVTKNYIWPFAVSLVAVCR